LNLGARAQGMRAGDPGAIALSTHLDRAGERVDQALELRAHEGVIVRIGR